MTLTHLNPKTLDQNPVFSQGVLVEGGSLLVVGGQNGIDGEGKVVSDDIGSQSAQALRNVIAVLEEGGATQADVVQLTVYLVAPADASAAFAAAQEVWGQHPTTVSVIQVSGLARPDCLVEVSALAQVS
jgi:enamine deaminase RidA (YjgF/YER057c/UK114 family)